MVKIIGCCSSRTVWHGSKRCGSQALLLHSQYYLIWAPTHVIWPPIWLRLMGISLEHISGQASAAPHATQHFYTASLPPQPRQISSSIKSISNVQQLYSWISRYFIGFCLNHHISKIISCPIWFCLYPLCCQHLVPLLVLQLSYLVLHLVQQPSPGGGGISCTMYPPKISNFKVFNWLSISPAFVSICTNHNRASKKGLCSKTDI